jgi:hypothetical protein
VTTFRVKVRIKRVKFIKVPMIPTRAMIAASLNALDDDKRPTPAYIGNRDKHIWRYTQMMLASPHFKTMKAWAECAASATP